MWIYSKLSLNTQMSDDESQPHSQKAFLEAADTVRLYRDAGKNWSVLIPLIFTSPCLWLKQHFFSLSDNTYNENFTRLQNESFKEYLFILPT